LRITKTTIIECLNKLCEGVIAIYAEKYLRRPNIDDIQRLLRVGEAQGFSGML
jgi:hypothetical protein